MKIIIYLGAILFVLSGCLQQSAENQQSGNRSVVQQKSINPDIDTLCFERYSSLKKQDTASIMLIIEGNRASGRFSNFPYQKDARIGTISGSRAGNLIRGTWHYQQEGMQDSIQFEFKLQEDQLLQKATAFDQETGREVFSDTAAFRLVFDEVDCRRNDRRMRPN